MIPAVISDMVARFTANNLSLDDLFKTARDYGRVNIFTQEDGTYSAYIKFNTSKNVELEARSGFGHSSPQGALLQAIEAAEKIKEGMQP